MILTIMFILLVLAVVVLLVLHFKIERINKNLRTALQETVTAMRELEEVSQETVDFYIDQVIDRNNQIKTLVQKSEENNVAWQQGLDEQQECYEQEFLSKNERISTLLSEITYLNSRLTNALETVVELEELHAYHKDHCLPVLTHMRNALKEPHEHGYVKHGEEPNLLQEYLNGRTKD